MYILREDACSEKREKKRRYSTVSVPRLPKVFYPEFRFYHITHEKTCVSLGGIPKVYDGQKDTEAIL
jgi:hypothetical protein